MQKAFFLLCRLSAKTFIYYHTVSNNKTKFEENYDSIKILLFILVKFFNDINFDILIKIDRFF